MGKFTLLLLYTAAALFSKALIRDTSSGNLRFSHRS